MEIGCVSHVMQNRRIQDLKIEAHQIIESTCNLGAARSEVYKKLAIALKQPRCKVHFSLINDEIELRQAIYHLKKIQYSYGANKGLYYRPNSNRLIKKKKRYEYKKTMLSQELLRESLEKRKPLTVWQKVLNLLNHHGVHL